MVMKLAERASKQYAELERITVNVKKAYTQPPEKRKKGKRQHSSILYTIKCLFFLEPKNRSAPVDHPPKEEEPSHRLTAEEMEYLEYFTDFCEYQDDPRSYGIKDSFLPSISVNVKNIDNEETKDVDDLDTNLLLKL